VFPTALSITALRLIREKLQPSLESLHQELQAKADDFAPIRKIGRTHLQDAVILSLGQEFSGYARQAELSLDRLKGAQDRLLSLPLGGTAVGTGANAHPDFARKVISGLAASTGLEVFETPNHFESQGACDGAVELSGVLKTIAVSLSKIANDIRWLASGPRCGLGEINLPAVQPGSSIMPGKVNPVIPESLIQACAQVVGNDAAITCGGQGGYFELNTMLPLVAHNLIQSLELLANGSREMAKRCVRGITANRRQCEDNIRKSLALATYLAPHIGYDRAAKIAHEAYASERSIEEVAREQKVLSEEALQQALYGRSTG
jgi:fumarate hydratase class II